MTKIADQIALVRTSLAAYEDMAARFPDAETGGEHNHFRSALVTDHPDVQAEEVDGKVRLYVVCGDHEPEHAIKVYCAEGPIKTMDLLAFSRTNPSAEIAVAAKQIRADAKAAKKSDAK